MEEQEKENPLTKDELKSIGITRDNISEMVEIMKRSHIHGREAVTTSLEEIFGEFKTETTEEKAQQPNRVKIKDLEKSAKEKIEKAEHMIKVDDAESKATGAEENLRKIIQELDSLREKFDSLSGNFLKLVITSQKDVDDLIKDAKKKREELDIAVESFDETKQEVERLKSQNESQNQNP